MKGATRFLPLLCLALVTCGAPPLTLYTLHVTALAVDEPEPGGTALGTLLALHLIAALVIGVTVRAAGWRGPLEAAVGAVSGAARRAVAQGG